MLTFHGETDFYFLFHSAVKKICAKSRQMLTVVKSQYENLVEKIPTGQYYRSVICNHYRLVMQKLRRICQKYGMKIRRKITDEDNCNQLYQHRAVISKIMYDHFDVLILVCCNFPNLFGCFIMRDSVHVLYLKDKKKILKL